MSLSTMTYVNDSKQVSCVNGHVWPIRRWNESSSIVASTARTSRYSLHLFTTTHLVGASEREIFFLPTTARDESASRVTKKSLVHRFEHDHSPGLAAVGDIPTDCFNIANSKSSIGCLLASDSLFSFTRSTRRFSRDFGLFFFPLPVGADICSETRAHCEPTYCYCWTLLIKAIYQKRSRSSPQTPEGIGFPFLFIFSSFDFLPKFSFASIIVGLNRKTISFSFFPQRSDAKYNFAGIFGK